MGILEIVTEEKYGGSGRDLISAYSIIEELARRSVVVAWIFCEIVFLVRKTSLYWEMMPRKKNIYPRLAKGDIMFCCGLTEPNAGPDTAAAKIFAERDGK
jgi:alkylation response protein AidB-like acyl-CoA dehydrogenase